jgi:hypothetical protein
MSAFKTTKIIDTTLIDLNNVMSAVKTYFEAKGYNVAAVDSAYGFFLSLTKGGIFKSVLGLKTSLNVNVKRISTGISVDASVGIFGQQLIPTVIMLFIAWPVIISQITGLVKQAYLDNEVVEIIEEAIRNNESKALADGEHFCVECGKKFTGNTNLCSDCLSENKHF